MSVMTMSHSSIYQIVILSLTITRGREWFSDRTAIIQRAGCTSTATTTFYSTGAATRPSCDNNLSGWYSVPCRYFPLLPFFPLLSLWLFLNCYGCSHVEVEQSLFLFLRWYQLFESVSDSLGRSRLLLVVSGLPLFGSALPLSLIFAFLRDYVSFE